jgi:mannose-6-phosphate isomerase-like protein (cupin superfamily)
MIVGRHVHAKDIWPGEQTGGAFTLLEAVVPLGGGPPPHIHHLEDEVFVILEGELLVTWLVARSRRRSGRSYLSRKALSTRTLW